MARERRRSRAGLQALRTGKALAGLSIVAVFALIALIGPWIAPDDPSTNTPDLLSGPSSAHLLGTTQLGQDVLSELLVGTRSSILTAVIAAAVATVLSVVIGVSSGYLVGVGGEVLSALSNVFLVIPALPLVIVLSGYLHGGGTVQVAIVISVTGWAFGARVLRAQTLSIRQRDFVIAAKASGERPLRIVTHEILPQLLPIVLSGFLLTAIFAIITQTTLAFLGLVNISQWSWGTMLYWTQSSQAYANGAWWWYVPPGLCIALFGMGIGLLNFSIDEIVNPRLRGARQATRPAGRRTVSGPAVVDALDQDVVISGRRLNVAYGSEAAAVRAVRDVDIQLRRGRVLGIAGESGCGKSTLAFAIAQLLQGTGHVESGSLTFQAPGAPPIDVLALEGEALRRFRWERLSLVPQAALNGLNPVLTVGAQLRDVLVDHRGRREKDLLAERPATVLRLVGLSDRVLRSYPHELSGGMRQRVMIALAALLDPDVVIMDEPTTALDVVTQRQIIERLLVLRQQLDLTIAFITHDLSLLMEIADEVLIMYAGRVVEHGPASELRANPTHPYTRGLLASFPPLGGRVRRLTGIPGSPPDMARLPVGCAFSPRCAHASTQCLAHEPPLEGTEGHETACWHPDRPGDPSLIPSSEVSA